jgi:hypothetical protein
MSYYYRSRIFQHTFRASNAFSALEVAKFLRLRPFASRSTAPTGRLWHAIKITHVQKAFCIFMRRRKESANRNFIYAQARGGQKFAPVSLVRISNYP